MIDFRDRQTPASSREKNIRAVHPQLPYVAFDLSEILEQMRRERVPDAPARVPVYFFDQDRLAFINLMDGIPTRISIHVLFNSPDTPRFVFRYILTHELLHAVIPARDIDGKCVSHPPEFRERETLITPAKEIHDAWRWIYGNFGMFIRRDVTVEKTYVRKGWRELLHTPRLDLKQCRHFAGESEDDATDLDLI